VLNSIEDGYQLDSVYTEFSKAFDRERHQLLLDEMSAGTDAFGLDLIRRGVFRK
jgi:hypothetical protein